MTNLDQEELHKFESLAADWWDPHGRLKTLHIINPARLKYITAAVDLKDRTVLDVGCGGGILCEAMAAKTARVTGIDASCAAIEAANQHQKQSGLTVTYLNCTVEEFATRRRQTFDVITCMELLEHVPDPVMVIETISGLLNPGGHLFLSTINRTLRAYAGAIITAEYLLGLLPRETHDYSKFIRPSELCQWLRASGLTIKDISGLKYLPMLDYAVVDTDPSINYMVHARLDD
jgi:2-polyprenyl-6-hydroxyphenyl methylase/3-demethylubiquinone-9 3-methyltransferase